MDIRSVGLSFLAAGMFSAGALLMKASVGLQRMWPTVAMFSCFIIGAALNTVVIFRGGREVGPTYVFVIGCETILAFALATLIFHERVTAGRLLGIALVGLGSVLLATSSAGAENGHESSSVSGYGDTTIVSVGPAVSFASDG